MRLGRSSLKLLIGKPELVGAEVGVHQGINAFDMLIDLRIKMLYLIDHYEGMYNIYSNPTPNIEYLHIAKEKLSAFDHCIEWLIKRSQDVTEEEIPDSSLDFAYIDGSHEYAEVKKDCELYWRKVKSGGLLCGHDFNNEVEQAVHEFAREHEVILEHDSIDVNEGDWWIWKP